MGMQEKKDIASLEELLASLGYDPRADGDVVGAEGASRAEASSADAERGCDAALAAIEAARSDALRSIREAQAGAEESIRGLHAKGARTLGEANRLVAASVAEARDEAVGRVRAAAAESEAAVRSANDGLEERLRQARERMDALVAQRSEEAARAALEQAEALVEERSEGLPAALGGEAVNTPGGSSTCDFGRREARERHSRRLKGLLVGGCAAVALCCAVGLGTAVLSDSFPAILQTSAQAEEPSQGDATASADGLLAEGAAKRATYTYRLEGEAGDVSMTETVTSGVDGLCRDTVMEGEFPSAEEAQAFLDSVSASYGSACSQADIEGSRARVAIDVSSLGLTQDEYEDALRASAKDLQATK